MEVQLNTDKHIDGHERLELYIKDTVSKTLKRYEDHLMRVVVHLADENAAKEGPRDKKCVMEARPAGLKPIAVTCIDETVEKAVNGALEKLKSSLAKTTGRLQNH
ncbi:MAG: HPF/RaiA family ribosome-associated protein [Brumimicrobium sp.]|nr:HPF/RaiA family ribosome-associated protein [Brumimicrobium sp.]